MLFFINFICVIDRLHLYYSLWNIIDSQNCFFDLLKVNGYWLKKKKFDRRNNWLRLEKSVVHGRVVKEEQSRKVRLTSAFLFVFHKIHYIYSVEMIDIKAWEDVWVNNLVPKKSWPNLRRFSLSNTIFLFLKDSYVIKKNVNGLGILSIQFYRYQCSEVSLVITV